MSRASGDHQAVSSARRRSLGVLSLVCLLAAASRSGAQERVARIQPEARVDVIAARAATLQVGVGASVPLGIYARVGVIGAAGVTRTDRVSQASARGDVVARFLLDPFLQSRWGAYVGAGLSVRYDSESRAYLVATLGVEGPPRRGLLMAGEVGVGGGARVGMVVRRAMPSRR